MMKAFAIEGGRRRGCGREGESEKVGSILLAQAATGVGPLEAPGQDVADVAEVEKEKRHSYYRVHYSRDFAPFRPGTNVAVACAVNENAAGEFISTSLAASSRSYFTRRPRRRCLAK